MSLEMIERPEMVKALFKAGIIDKKEAIDQVDNMRAWIGLEKAGKLPWGR